ncbi:MAG: hypothetical protein M1830_001384 [Pleopsidium flavum]|nr:MAG: hypothetical protein M1830_001384 [Pleopsidium flavum]
MALLRQTGTLTLKSLLIAFVRHAFSTTIRAFLLPLVLVGFLAYARNLFIPPSHYGIGTATPIRSLGNALNAATGGRDTVVFVNNGFTGGAIDKVIQQVAQPARAEGKIVKVQSNEADLQTICRNSLRGVSTCYAAAVFYASPTEGNGGIWNYTIRADGALGSKIDTTNAKNDVEVYAIPLQHAIDFTIASLNTTIDQSALPDQVMEYPYTSKTQKERSDDIRVRYMGGIVDILAVAFFIGIVGVTYQLVGMMASERELGMSQLIEAMMPNKRRWEPQVARLVSNHLAFDIIYLPGWIGMALILSYGVFSKTSVAILLVFNLLSGLALSSFSILGGSFFKKSQLSGISTTIISLLLAVLAQVIGKSNSGAVAILSLLFPPMNYVFFTILMARWERQNIGTKLLKAAPENPWGLPGIVLWVFLIIQILVFPVLGALVERALYGTASKGRTVTSDGENPTRAVELSSFSKQYRASWFSRHVGSRFGKRQETVVAVNDLSLTVMRGQIMVLLGANGSGKSTTLDAIAGLSKVTSGTISVDGTGGLGVCPQKNVLWDELSVEEHVRIFNRLKFTETRDTKAQIHNLIAACDLDRKLTAKSKTLSGGQKRKLQLGMMFTGGSRVCAVDEISSGLDPLSRRKIWDILLAERGARTILLTTHFLDEADLLSDHIAILSKGTLKAEGSAVELKHKLGGGYRVHIYNVPGASPAPHFEGIPRKQLYDQTIYSVLTSAEAARFIAGLEQQGIRDYQVNGPTIEDVFLKVAEEIRPDSTDNQQEIEPQRTSDQKIEEGVVSVLDEKSSGTDMDDKGLRLLTGKRIGMASQAWVLFRKRLTILRRNYLPYCAAFLIPVIAAGLVTLFLKGFQGAGCSPTDQLSIGDISSLITQLDFQLVIGPSSKLDLQALRRFESTLPGGDGSGIAGGTALKTATHMVDTLEEFNQYINQRYANVTPGGFFLGEKGSPPTFAYKGNADISLATITQNALDNLLTNVSISSQYQSFDVPWPSAGGNTLQLITYFGLAMAAYPAFFALYPTVERLRNVRRLHYSNGVRSLPLWLAYISFDFLIVIAASVLATVIFRGVTNVWYHLEYLFVVFFLYGLASTLLSYAISLFAKSQLAAFALAAGGQAVMFLLYFIAYLSVLTYAPTNKIDSYVNVVHFTIALITPAGNLVRSLFVALNAFSILCRDRSIASYPGEITLYGGPILYLTLQSLFLFGVLLWWDSGPIFGSFRKNFKSQDIEESEVEDDEVSKELARVNSSSDGLRVLHLTKAFRSNVAVQDVTFGVKRGEVFALLGPNGAGKSTTISLIRGDIQPSQKGGEIFVENIPISKRRAAARSHLGVCPQFDAMDQMTVVEHLRFYARIRGVSDVEHNVREVIRAVGLESFSSRMAAKLSGGNKRKLSLGVALMGNPSVLLLDEPSSGMDAASKRVMWRTLASVVPGRSLVLTTHSMEEADALANRAGIMAKKMLALGTSDDLRRKHGDAYHVHLVTTTAPHTSTDEMDRIKRWIFQNFPGAVIEDKTYHGQMRFSVPTGFDGHGFPSATSEDSTKVQGQDRHQKAGISALFTSLEMNKEYLGFEYYSVSQTTLDQVFLSIVGKHNVEEENYASEVKKRPLWKRFR